MDIQPDELIAILTVVCAATIAMVNTITTLLQLDDNRERPSPLIRHQIRQLNFFWLIYEDDQTCRENTRMDRRTFTILCQLLRMTGMLRPTKYVDVEEMVAIFLHIVAHDVKNRVMRRQFARSGETVSRHFNIVLNAILRLYDVLLRKLEPVTENCTDDRWRWFQVQLLFCFNGIVWGFRNYLKLII